MAALLVTTALPLVSMPAASAQYGDLLVLDVGHVDGLDIQSAGGGIQLKVFDDRDASDTITREPSDVLFHVKPEAEFVIPEGLPTSYGFLGQAGDTVWLLPEVQSENPEVAWLGWASQRTAPGTITGNLTLSMTDVQGPGDVLLFQSGPFGDPINIWGSAPGLSPSVAVLQNAHVHSTWVFTAPGAYTISFEATGTSATTGTTISTGQVEYRFHVGALPDDPGGGSTDLTITGLQDSYQAGETVSLTAVQDPATVSDSYQWFAGPAGAADLSVIHGAQSATYDFTATEEMDGARYLVRLYDDEGALVASSAEVTVQIGDDDPPPTLSQTITATLDEDAGSLVVSVDPDDRDVVMGPFSLSGDGSRWESTGELRPVVVTDTRSTEPGWNLSGQVSDFSSGTTTVGGEHLGWAPSVTSSGQGVVAGAGVAPGTGGGEGLSSSRGLASAPAGSGVGTATLGGRLDLHLPTSAEPGTYTAVLTLTAI